MSGFIYTMLTDVAGVMHEAGYVYSYQEQGIFSLIWST